MKLADYSQQVTVDQLDAALHAGGFDGVFHYITGTAGFVLRLEDPQVVAGIRARGWPQAGISVPRAPGNVNGLADASAAEATYGFPAGTRLYLDIEPQVFDPDPASWAQAADIWCGEIRSSGYSPGIYGVDRTVAACGNHADTIWRAVPGMCDPAAAGPQGLNPDFKPGVRAVQCQAATIGGVDFDISFSQFDLGGNAMTRNDWVAFYGALIVILLRDPPNVLTGQTDPVTGGTYYEDFYWADQALKDPVAAIRQFLNQAKAQAKVVIPLVGVAAGHTHDELIPALTTVATTGQTGPAKYSA